MRDSSIERKTKETDIKLSLSLDGKGDSDIDTGIGFFDHVLSSFAKHGFFDLSIKAVGDLEVDGHHTVEDCGIVLGSAIKEAVGDKKGINRFGYFILPMDDALVLCAVDLCGRPYFVMDGEFTGPFVGDLDTQLIKEFFYSVSYAADMNLHLRIISGENDHHVIEAMFKAFGKALDMAVKYDERQTGIPSTKGSL